MVVEGFSFFPIEELERIFISIFALRSPRIDKSICKQNFNEQITEVLLRPRPSIGCWRVMKNPLAMVFVFMQCSLVDELDNGQ